MKNFTLLSFSALTALFLSGCSIMAPSRQVVALNIQPEDAEVIANGLLYPGGSIFVEVQPDRELLLTIRRDGYYPVKYVVPTHLSTTGKIDAWSSILIFPFFGLFAPGAWQLEESVVNIQLQPLSPPISAPEESTVKPQETNPQPEKKQQPANELAEAEKKTTA